MGHQGLNIKPQKNSFRMCKKKCCQKWIKREREIFQKNVYFHVCSMTNQYCLSEVSEVNWIGVFYISLEQGFTLWQEQIRFFFSDIIGFCLAVAVAVLSGIINVMYLLTLPSLFLPLFLIVLLCQESNLNLCLSDIFLL